MTQTADAKTPVILCILDGWGLRDDPTDNALAQARLPTYRRLLETRPFARIGTSGRDVGLPDGQMGNSEVGHMNIGAGRIAVPDLGRLNNRSEEHTSELQSLMRISYAVFCLKKKKKHIITTNNESRNK